MASNNRIDVRAATLEDAELLATLNTHVHALHLRAEPVLYRATDLGELRAWFREKLAEPDVVIFIASTDQPLGFAVAVHAQAPRNPFSPARERILVDQIAVVPTQRRTGVGRALMEAAERHAQARGLTSVQLDVRAFNTEAIRFYRSLGYAPVQLRLERKLDRAPRSTRSRPPVAVQVGGPVSEEELQALFLASWPERTSQSYASVLSNSLTWVTARSEELIGFVNVATDGGVHAFVLDTTVHPSVQRLGVGRNLVAAAVLAVKAHGVRWLHVDYAQDLEPFYQSCGFTPTSAGLIDLHAFG